MGGERRLGCGCVRWVRGVTRAEEIRECVIFPVVGGGGVRSFAHGVDVGGWIAKVSRGDCVARGEGMYVHMTYVCKPYIKLKTIFLFS